MQNYTIKTREPSTLQKAEKIGIDEKRKKHYKIHAQWTHYTYSFILYT